MSNNWSKQQLHWLQWHRSRIYISISVNTLLALDQTQSLLCTFKVGTRETRSDTWEVPKALNSLLSKSLHQINLNQRGPAPKMSKEQDVTGFRGGRIGTKANFFFENFFFFFFGRYLTKSRGRFSTELPKWKLVTNTFHTFLFLEEVREGGSVAYMLIFYCWNYRSDGSW